MISCLLLFEILDPSSNLGALDILTLSLLFHLQTNTAKTALPRMWKTTKATFGLGQFPMNITGMVAHDHVDGVYAHYAPAL